MLKITIQMQIHYTTDENSIEIQPLEVDLQWSILQLRQTLQRIFNTTADLILYEKKYVQDNSYYKLLQYDILTLEKVDFNDRSLVLVKRVDSLPLSQPKPPKTEEEEMVDIIKAQLKKRRN
ncbi:Ubiquitin-like domain-containing protein [Entamoeba marina]